MRLPHVFRKSLKSNSKGCQKIVAAFLLLSFSSAQVFAMDAVATASARPEVRKNFIDDLLRTVGREKVEGGRKSEKDLASSFKLHASSSSKETFRSESRSISEQLQELFEFAFKSEDKYTDIRWISEYFYHRLIKMPNIEPFEIEKGHYKVRVIANKQANESVSVSIEILKVDGSPLTREETYEIGKYNFNLHDRLTGEESPRKVMDGPDGVQKVVLEIKGDFMGVPVIEVSRAEARATYENVTKIKLDDTDRRLILDLLNYAKKTGNKNYTLQGIFRSLTPDQKAQIQKKLASIRERLEGQKMAKFVAALDGLAHTAAVLPDEKDRQNPIKDNSNNRDLRLTDLYRALIAANYFLEGHSIIFDEFGDFFDFKPRSEARLKEHRLSIGETVNLTELKNSPQIEFAALHDKASLDYPKAELVIDGKKMLLAANESHPIGDVLLTVTNIYSAQKSPWVSLNVEIRGTAIGQKSSGNSVKLEERSRAKARESELSPNNSSVLFSFDPENPLSEAGRNEFFKAIEKNKKNIETQGWRRNFPNGMLLQEVMYSVKKIDREKGIVDFEIINNDNNTMLSKSFEDQMQIAWIPNEKFEIIVERTVIGATTDTGRASLKSQITFNAKGEILLTGQHPYYGSVDGVGPAADLLSRDTRSRSESTAFPLSKIVFLPNYFTIFGYVLTPEASKKYSEIEQNIQGISPFQIYKAGRSEVRENAEKLADQALGIAQEIRDGNLGRLPEVGDILAGFERLYQQGVRDIEAAENQGSIQVAFVLFHPLLNVHDMLYASINTVIEQLLEKTIQASGLNPAVTLGEVLHTLIDRWENNHKLLQQLLLILTHYRAVDYARTAIGLALSKKDPAIIKSPEKYAAMINKTQKDSSILLIEKLRSPDARERERAAKTLSSFNPIPSDAIPGLVHSALLDAVYDEEDKAVDEKELEAAQAAAREARNTLLKIGLPALPALLEAVRSGKGPGRRRIAELLTDSTFAANHKQIADVFIKHGELRSYLSALGIPAIQALLEVSRNERSRNMDFVDAFAEIIIVKSREQDESFFTSPEVTGIVSLLIKIVDNEETNLNHNLVSHILYKFQDPLLYRIREILKQEPLASKWRPVLQKALNSKFPDTRFWAGRLQDSILSEQSESNGSRAEARKVMEFSARKSTDSRGKPTVEVTLKIGDIEVTGDVPAGASKGQDEARTVDVDQAVYNINQIIAPMMNGLSLDLSRHKDLIKAEKHLIKAAGKNFEDLGANATVPVSRALWKMAARLNDMKLADYIRTSEPEAVDETNTKSVIFLMNIFNGGLHALKEEEELGVDRIDFQEIMIAPVGVNNQQALIMGDKIDFELKKLLSERHGADKVTRADEAGFSVKGLGSSEQAIEAVFQATKQAGYEMGKDVKLALDVAASSFYKNRKYKFQGQELSSGQMIEFYIALAQKYEGKILSIEDGLAENDWRGSKKLKAAMAKYGIETIGDDLFVTQLPRLKKGIAQDAASAILIKVNQNGTMYGTLEVIKHAKRAGKKWVVSHRSGETLDDSIADLAFATKAFGLKAGDPQPLYDFGKGGQYQDKALVRRVKYEEMVALEKLAARSEARERAARREKVEGGREGLLKKISGGDVSRAAVPTNQATIALQLKSSEQESPTEPTLGLLPLDKSPFPLAFDKKNDQDRNRPNNTPNQEPGQASWVKGVPTTPYS